MNFINDELPILIRFQESKSRQESSTQMDYHVLSNGNNTRTQQQQQQQTDVLLPTAGRSVNEVSDLRRSVATNTSMLWPQIQNDLRQGCLIIRFFA